MSPARAPRDRPLDDRLLVVDPGAGDVEDARVRDLPRYLRAGDLLVVNDAGTLPASLAGRLADGAPIELRLLRGEGAAWEGLVFGAGDWRTPTEHRPSPPPLAPGAILAFAGLQATVTSVDAAAPRLVCVRFDRDGASLWMALYRAGKPIQYSHLERPLDLWSVQTSYGARPWAVEMPSAGRPLTWSLLLELRRRGVAVARLTEAAGLTSTGEAALDARLPMPERFEIPAATAHAIERARARGGRVVAIGTSVVRALEAAAEANGFVRAGRGETCLVLGPGTPLRVVDGLLTGMHEPTSSHFALLQAFCPRHVLEVAYARASAAGYLVHEFGDSNLILPLGEGAWAARGAVD